MKLTILPLIVCTALTLVAATEVRALPDAEAAAGRLIFRKYADAVVVVKLTIVFRIKMGERVMPPSENKLDVNGTLIEPSGLTVTALSAIDPNVIYDAVRSKINVPSTVPVEQGPTEVKNLRLQLGDGTELPVRIVWKDSARDLALLFPEDASAASKHTFTWVNLNEGPEAAMLLGNYYHLSRLFEAMQRIAIIRPCTITSIIERPRRLLLVSTDMFADTLGCPVFDAQGRVLGICLHQMVDGAIRGFVVMPAADIAEIVALAAAQ